MKTLFLFALFLTGSQVFAGDVSAGPFAGAPHRNLRNRPAQRFVRVTRTTIPVSRMEPARPSPVGEIHEPPFATGVLPRALTARNPAQMINPLAPPEYGSARNLVVYTDRDIYRTDDQQKNKQQPYAIRLLTLRPLW